MYRFLIITLLCVGAVLAHAYQLQADTGTGEQGASMQYRRRFGFNQEQVIRAACNKLVLVDISGYTIISCFLCVMHTCMHTCILVCMTHKKLLVLANPL